VARLRLHAARQHLPDRHRGAAGRGIAYALGSLQIRQYDPLGNLRKAGE
jgi:hypothetical protein